MEHLPQRENVSNLRPLQADRLRNKSVWNHGVPGPGLPLPLLAEEELEPAPVLDDEQCGKREVNAGHPEAVFRAREEQVDNEKDQQGRSSPPVRAYWHQQSSFRGRHSPRSPGAL